MGEGALQVWLVFKWLVPVAFGSGLAVFLDKTENTFKRKCCLFFFGAAISVIGGGAIIEHYPNLGNAAQGLIYFSLGLWGMGIVVQLSEKIPPAVSRLFDKCLLIADRWLERFGK
jgi:hypothetical protein